MSKSAPATNYSRATDAVLDVRPITPAIGAEIHGARLSGDLPAATVTAIRDALLRHRVIFSAARAISTKPRIRSSRGSPTLHCDCTPVDSG